MIYYKFDPAQPLRDLPANTKYKFAFVYTTGRRNRQFQSEKSDFAEAMEEYKAAAAEWKTKKEPKLLATYRIENGVNILMDTEIYVTSYLLSDIGTVVKSDKPEIGRPHSYTYLHGIAETAMIPHGGYDIPCFFNNYPQEVGVHQVKILYPENRIADGSYFLWIGKDQRHHGLVVDNSDSKNLLDAFKKYDEKRSNL